MIYPKIEVTPIIYETEFNIKKPKEQNIHNGV